MAGDKNKNKIWGPSALFTCVSNYLSAATCSSSALGNAKRNCQPLFSDYPLNDPVPFLSGLSLVLGYS